MALTTSTKNTLYIMGLLVAGGLGYLLWSRRKGKTMKGFAVSKLTPEGKFSIYVVKSILPKSNLEALINDYTSATFNKQVTIKGLPKMNEVAVGQEIKIKGGKGLNGKYKVIKKWYSSSDPKKEAMIGITLQNANNDWDGDLSKYNKPTSAKGTRYTVPKGFTVVT
jgi:hypothetical protein